MRRTLWFFILGILLPCAAAAQETRGNISGTVRDEQGVVPGASVKITNVETQVSQNLLTNDSGYFEAPLLNAGRYEVTVQMTGFKSATRSNVVLGVGQQLTVPFMSIQRSFRAGGNRTWQLRVDAQNLFNRQQWQGANLNPTSTLFGQVTNVALNQMRFFTFGARMTF